MSWQKRNGLHKDKIIAYISILVFEFLNNDNNGEVIMIYSGGEKLFK